jgi:Putative transposase
MNSSLDSTMRLVLRRDVRQPLRTVVRLTKGPSSARARPARLSPHEFMQRLAAPVRRPRVHLIRFHGVLAPNAKLRPLVVPQEPRAAGAGQTARRGRGELCATPPGAAELGQAAQARLGCDITWIQVSLR